MPEALPRTAATAGTASSGPTKRQLKPAWAEKYFDNHTEAFDYSERRRAEHPTGRVHRPVQSHEKPAAWAVCVDPV